MTDQLFTPHSTWEAECKALRARVAELEAALEWYGHEVALMGKVTIDAQWAASRLSEDRGKKARAALKGGNT